MSEGSRKDEAAGWAKGLPFPRHWLYYVVVKLVLLIVAVWIVLRLYGLV